MKKRYFKKALLTLGVFATAFVLGSCSNEDNYWTEPVTISGNGVSQHMATIELGTSLQLNAYNGLLVAGEGFEWESSNPEVATIDQNGLVKAVSVGETIITVTTTGSNHTHSGQITVYVVNIGVGIVDDQIDQSEAE